jgi:biotin carboxylase
MPRVLLLVPSGTYRAGDFLDAAKALGVDVVVAGDHDHALAPAMGARWIQVPFDDPEAAADAIVAHDATAPLDAVVAVDDAGTVVAAAACQRLGLRYNAPDAVAAARHKLVMRTLLERAEVPQPVFVAVAPDADDDAVARLARQVGLPCVVKPATLSGSQGVLRADTAEEAGAVVARVRRIAASAGVGTEVPLVMERFVAGVEVAVEGLLVDGDLEILAVFDKPDPLDGPAFEETIYVTPSRLSAPDMTAVAQVTSAATSAMGLRHGPVHAEVRVHDGRATVIEVAARTIGGLCSRTLAFATGRSLEEVVLAHALGIAPGAAPGHQAAGVLMIPIGRAGCFLGVDGIDDALMIPGIVDIQITAVPGRVITPVPDGNKYLGFVFATGRRPEQAEAALRRAQATLKVRIGDDDEG